MLTNKEWLYSLDPHELTEWFDAQHEANDDLPHENDVSAEDMDANDANVAHDSREKLEEDVRKWCGMYPYQADMVWAWLNRQAAITERELCKQCDWPSLAAQTDLESQERIAELTAEWTNADTEREQYRELLSEAITQAAEIVNLQP